MTRALSLKNVLERSWHNTNQNHHYFQKSNWQFNESYYQFWSLSRYSSVRFITRSGVLELIACSSTKTKTKTKAKPKLSFIVVCSETNLWQKNQCTPPIRVYLRRLEAVKTNYVCPFLKQFLKEIRYWNPFSYPSYLSNHLSLPITDFWKLCLHCFLLTNSVLCTHW